VDVAQYEAERQRQVLLNEKSKEVSSLAKAGEVRRQQVMEVSVAKRRILDEMRAVRTNMEEKTCAARARGNHNMGVANRALARAGKTALSARGESERWQARAQGIEDVLSSSSTREAEMLSSAHEGCRQRMALAEELATQRVQLGQRLVDETNEIAEQAWKAQEDHCLAQEAHARQVATLKVQGAEGARQEAAAKEREAEAVANAGHAPETGDAISESPPPPGTPSTVTPPDKPLLVTVPSRTKSPAAVSKRHNPVSADKPVIVIARFILEVLLALSMTSKVPGPFEATLPLPPGCAIPFFAVTMIRNDT